MAKQSWVFQPYVWVEKNDDGTYKIGSDFAESFSHTVQTDDDGEVYEVDGDDGAEGTVVLDAWVKANANPQANGDPMPILSESFDAAAAVAAWRATDEQAKEKA